jgi:hypothetical protein
MSTNKVIVVSPQNAKEYLSTEEWQLLLNIIDKLSTNNIELQITYTNIIRQHDQ